MRIGKYVHKMLQENNIPVQKLSKSLNIQLSEILKWQNSNPPDNVLHQIASFFGQSLEDFFFMLAKRFYIRS